MSAGLIKDLKRICRNLRPEQVLSSGHYGNARLKKVYPVPDYLEKYTDQATPHRYSTGKLAWCVQGPAVMTADDVSYKMEAGSMFLLPRNLLHYESFYKKQNPYSLILLQVHEWGKVTLHRSLYGKDGRFAAADIFSVEAGPDAMRTVDALTQDGGEDFAGFHERLNGFVKLLAAGEQKPHIPLSNRWQLKMVREIHDWLGEHIRENVDLKALAARYEYTPAYLSALFKRRYGLGLGQYLTRNRLRLASVDLEHTGKSVADIALDYGYEDVSYFIRVFKKVYGVTPNGYRKKFS